MVTWGVRSGKGCIRTGETVSVERKRYCCVLWCGSSILREVYLWVIGSGGRGCGGLASHVTHPLGTKLREFYLTAVLGVA